jgi:hypothetical protein
MMLSFALVPRSWGFRVTSLSVTTNGIPEFNPPEHKTDRKIDRAAKKFYRSVAAGRPKPGISDMVMFMTAQPSIRRVPRGFFDYMYWKDHGWLEKDAAYYYDPQAGIARKALARLLAKGMGLFP